MISDKSSLPSRLGWVLDETTLLLNETCRSFAVYVEAVDVASLDQALVQSRNLLGVLDLLDTEGAYMLCREAVLLMDAIRNEKVQNWKEACSTCADGLTLLLEYLKHLHEGYPDLPVIVLPMLNNLRASRDAELLSEHLVFLPAEGAVSNDQIGTEKYLSLEAEKLEQATRKLRFYMQKSLLGWFNNDRPGFHLQAAQKVTNNMIVLNERSRLRALWWVSGALLQALEEKKLEDSVAVKMLMGRMEREIKRFGDLQEDNYNASLPDELLKNLLYYVGLAETGEGRLKAVKDAFHLDLYLPKGETLEELRHYYTLPGRDLWQAVSVSLQDEIALIMSQVEALARHENPETLLGDVAKRTNGLAQTLGMLGLGTASDLTQTLAQTQQAMFEQQEIADPELLGKMSDHFVKLEALLREYAETGRDRTEDIFFADEVSGAGGAGATREVIRSLLNSLSQAQSSLAAYDKEPEVLKPLEDITQSLRHMAGSLDVLGNPEVEPLSSAVKLLVGKDILVNKRRPSSAEMDCIADVLTLLEAILGCISKQEDHLPLLAVGFEKIKALDEFTQLDLAQQVNLSEAQAEYEIKKKARLANPSTLYQKLRSQAQMAV